MTINLALEYVAKRMCEMGYGSRYVLRFRHLRLQPAEKKIIPAFGQLVLLIEPSDDIRVESNTGLFDLSEDLTDELQYEHQGEILVTNLSALSNHLRFIQIIPQSKVYVSH